MTENGTHSLYGATVHNEFQEHSLDAPSVPSRKGTGQLHPISEEMVVISNAEEWTEGITYYSMDQMMKEIVHDNKSDLSSTRKQNKLSPFYMAIFNMLAGCGVVGLPIQYKNADGIIMGITITILVAFISIYTMRLLVYTGIKLECQDYERLVSKCFGIYGYYFLLFSVLLFDIGACLCYTIILGNCAQDAMEHIFGNDLGIGTDKNRQLFICTVYILVILPLCVGKNFRFIEKIQIVGILIYIFLICVIIYKYYDAYQYTNDHSWKLYYNDHRRNFKDWMDILGSFGAITFSIIQHDLSFLVYKTVKNQTYTKFSILCFCGMGIQCILCILLCVYGYISFGDNVQDDILRNYSKRYPLIMFIRLFYMVRMAFIFPTAFYVVRHVLFAIIYRGYDSYEDTTIFKKIIFTIIPLSTLLVLGLYVRNLSDVMSLFGLLSAVNIAFVVPALCYLKDGREYPIMFWNAPSGKLGDAIQDVMPSIILIVFGLFAFIFGSLEFIYFHSTSQWLE